MANYFARADGSAATLAAATGPAGGITRIRRANDAALWYQKMNLKREDDEALKLLDKYLDS